MLDEAEISYIHKEKNGRAATAIRRLSLLQKPGPLLLLLIALCLAKGFIGPGPIRAYTRDSLSLIDGAWRVANGQRPYLDFYSDVGFLTFLPISLAMRFSHSVAAINWAVSLLGIAVALLSIPLVFRRVRSPFAGIYCAALVLMAIAPFLNGDSPAMITQACFYNRLGYALLGMVFIECVCPRVTNPSRFADFSGGFTTGLVTAAAFFLKFTYAAFAILLIGASIWFLPRMRRRWLGLASGAAAAGFAGLAFLHFDIADLIRGVRQIAGARHVGLLLLLGKPLQNQFRLASIAALVVVAVLILWQVGRRHIARKWMVALLLTLAIDAGALATNSFHQVADFPLTALALIPFLAEVTAVLPAEKTYGLLRKLLLVWGLSAALVNPVLDAEGLAFAAVRPLVQPALFQAQPIHAVFQDHLIPAEFSRLPDGTDPTIAQINDGIGLLLRETTPADKVAALWVGNPFSYWLERPPARGGSYHYDYGVNFSEKSGPSPQNAFGGATVVLMPKEQEDGSDMPPTNAILRIYGPFVESHFTLAAQSRLWSLYRVSAHAQSK